MAWINPSTVVSGGSLNATKWNQDVVANTEFLARPPSVSLDRTTEQSVVTTVWRSISWNTENWDTDTMWSSTAPTRIDINTAGKYLITAQCAFTASTAGTLRRLGIVTNAGSSTSAPNKGLVDQDPIANNNPLGLCFTRVLSFTSTESFRVQVLQNSGATISVQHDANFTISCSAIWMSS